MSRRLHLYRLSSARPCPPQLPLPAPKEQLGALLPPAAGGRGVLDGAFAVLGALAHADEGLGLTALARASGLAKSSTHRVVEQLVTLGAGQCVEHRYYVGPRMFRIGQRWQPNPLLRQRAQAPAHTLSAMASLRILHEDRLRLICASALRGHAYMSDPADAESMARTRDCLRRGKSFCALKDPVRSADRSFVLRHRPRRNELLQRCRGRADDLARACRMSIFNPGRGRYA